MKQLGIMKNAQKRPEKAAKITEEPRRASSPIAFPNSTVTGLEIPPRGQKCSYSDTSHDEPGVPLTSSTKLDFEISNQQTAWLCLFILESSYFVLFFYNQQ